MKLNIGLWFVQVLLCLFMLMVGLAHMGVIHPFGTEPFPWEANNPTWLPAFIGIAEVAGAIGLILPSALRIQPQLTVWAAKGLFVVCLLSAGVHIGLGDMAPVPNFVLALLTYFVIWGRSTARPIEAKS